jgi:hypothetical protein
MKNNSRKFELFVTIITAVSVIMILDDYIYKLSAAQKVAIYIFDFSVVVILAVDFYIRMRASNEGLDLSSNTGTKYQACCHYLYLA